MNDDENTDDNCWSVVDNSGCSVFCRHHLGLRRWRTPQNKSLVDQEYHAVLWRWSTPTAGTSWYRCTFALALGPTRASTLFAVPAALVCPKFISTVTTVPPLNDDQGKYDSGVVGRATGAVDRFVDRGVALAGRILFVRLLSSVRDAFCHGVAVRTNMFVRRCFGWRVEREWFCHGLASPPV